MFNRNGSVEVNLSMDNSKTYSTNEPTSLNSLTRVLSYDIPYCCFLRVVVWRSTKLQNEPIPGLTVSMVLLVNPTCLKFKSLIEPKKRLKLLYCSRWSKTRAANVFRCKSSCCTIGSLTSTDVTLDVELVVTYGLSITSNC